MCSKSRDFIRMTEDIFMEDKENIAGPSHFMSVHWKKIIMTEEKNMMNKKKISLHHKKITKNSQKNAPANPLKRE